MSKIVTPSIQLSTLLFCFALGSNSFMLNAQTVFGKMLDNAPYSNASPLYSKITSSFNNSSVVGGPSWAENYVSLSKFDSLATLLWSKKYFISGVNQVNLSEVLQLPDSGFIAVGKAYVPTTSQVGVFLFRVDKIGSPLWVNVFQEQTFIIVQHAVYNQGSIYVFGEGLDSAFSGQEGRILMKFDVSNGQLLNQRTFISNVYLPLFNQHIPNGMLVDNNQNLVIVERGGYNDYPVLLKFDSNLNLLFSNFYTSTMVPGSSIEFAGIDKLSSGEYILSGGSTFNSGFRSLLFLRLNSIGQVLTAKKYNVSNSTPMYNSFATSIHAMSNGTILLPFNSLSFLNINMNGDTLGKHFYRGGIFMDATISSDGNPIFLLDPVEYSAYSAILLKTDNAGYYNCNERIDSVYYDVDAIIANPFTPTILNHTMNSIPVSITDSIFNFQTGDFCLYNSIQNPDEGFNTIKLTPNPAQDVLHIDLSDLTFQNGFDANIFDISGQLVLRFENNQTIFVGDLPDGIYLLALNDGEGKTFTSRFIIHH